MQWLYDDGLGAMAHDTSAGANQKAEVPGTPGNRKRATPAPVNTALVFYSNLVLSGLAEKQTKHGWGTD